MKLDHACKMPSALPAVCPAAAVLTISLIHLALHICVAHPSFLGMVRLSELKSTVQNSRPIKSATTLPDDMITQREDAVGAVVEEEQGGDSGEQETGGTEARPRRRKPARLLETTAKLEPEEKPRARRQKDFDVAEPNESSDEESQKKERARAAEEPWTQNQQKLLELALQQYPKGSSDRWDKIARCVPSKSKVSDRERGLCTGVRIPPEEPQLVCLRLLPSFLSTDTCPMISSFPAIFQYISP